MQTSESANLDNSHIAANQGTLVASPKSNEEQTAASDVIKPGQILAEKYVVEGTIGRGAMGTVFIATHIETKDRIAFKRIDAAFFQSPSATDRLFRGARAAAAIESEHIAHIIDLGTLDPPDEGAVSIPFIVTEYLDGSDIATYVKRRGPMRVKEATKYLLQICEAMAQAHADGLIHRDLKPENIFLTFSSDGLPTVKVLDLGVSMIACRGESDGTVSATNAIRASLLFMAPEQMRSAGGVDERADIWSIGAVGYMLVSGKSPFDAETELEICAKVLTETPAALDLGGFQNVLLRCLEKDPDERFANVAELALSLARFGGEGAQHKAEHVWEVLTEDQTLRMVAPPIPSDEGVPDTEPHVPELFSEEPDDIDSAQLAPPSITLAEPTTEPTTEGEEDETLVSPGSVIPPREVTGTSVDAGEASRGSTREGPTHGRWAKLRRPIEIGAAAMVLLAVGLIWLVRDRVVAFDSGTAMTATTGIAQHVNRIANSHVAPQPLTASVPTSHAEPPPSTQLEPQAMPTSSESAQPLVPPPGGWQYPPDLIYEQAERERRREREEAERKRALQHK